MKRKIAIMLAAVMTTAMLPMSAMAASSNSVDRIDSVKNDEVIKNVNLKIEPKAAVGVDGDGNWIPSGASIIIKIENAEFDTTRSGAALPSYNGPVTGGEAVTWESMTEALWETDSVTTAYSTVGLTTNTAKRSDLPYFAKKISDTELQVFLAPVPAGAADESGVITPGKPYYSIPIKAVATSDEEDVKVTIDANGTSVSATTHTVATTSSENGATTTTVSKIKTGTDTVKVDDITVKETVKGSFDAITNKKDIKVNGETKSITYYTAAQVKVRVNGGFKIVNGSKIRIAPGINIEGNEIGVDYNTSDDYILFDLPVSWIASDWEVDDDNNVYVTGVGTDIASSFIIKGLEVEPDDEDKNWGDINITISGSAAGITKETIKVGERVDYGMEMTVKGEVPTIISGRTYLANTKDLDEDDFKAAKVNFKETAQDTWITTRKLEFTLPDGVKIVKVDYNDVKRINDGKATLEDKSWIAGDGQILKIDKGVESAYSSSKDEGMEFDFELYLSIDADFTGDVTCAVAGAGLAADTLEDVVIAEAVAPISVETATTKVNMGYQVFDAADITITEAQDGVLLDGEKVEVSFDDKKFGKSELGFNDTGVEYTVDGELEIKNFEVKEGTISFKVDKTSYTEPSSITISNLKVGTTRSVPYGTYDLKIGGEAVVNNYDKDVDNKIYNFKINDADKVENNKEVNRDRAYFDTTDGYSFDNYVEIVTEAGTLDGVVEVTIGEKTITVNGEPVDMDVAAYIQTSSNSTMVPLRFVSLALGVDTENVETADNTSKIAWDANSKTATILYAAGNGQKIIQFQAGSNYMVVDGTPIPMEYGVVAEITDSRMFVPFRALGQALGVPVDWDAETRTAIYNKR